jgi:hypothetical protein
MQKTETGRGRGRWIANRAGAKIGTPAGDGFANRVGVKIGTPAGVRFARRRGRESLGLSDRCGIGS